MTTLNIWELDFSTFSPHNVVGVFPVEGPPEWWSSFCYTVGFLPDFDLWTPCQSIEGAYAGPETAGGILSMLAHVLKTHQIARGQDVIVPLGVPDSDDVDTIWWIGDHFEPASRLQVNLGLATWALPILWSSPAKEWT